MDFATRQTPEPRSSRLKMCKTRDSLVLSIYRLHRPLVSLARIDTHAQRASLHLSVAERTRIASFGRLGRCGPVQITGAFYPLKRQPRAVVCPAAFAIKSDSRPCLLQLLPPAYPQSWRFLAASRSRSSGASLRASSCTRRSPPRRRTIRIPISLPASLSPYGRVRKPRPSHAESRASSQKG